MASRRRHSGATLSATSLDRLNAQIRVLDTPVHALGVEVCVAVGGSGSGGGSGSRPPSRSQSPATTAAGAAGAAAPAEDDADDRASASTTSATVTRHTTALENLQAMCKEGATQLSLILSCTSLLHTTLKFISRAASDPEFNSVADRCRAVQLLIILLQGDAHTAEMMFARYKDASMAVLRCVQVDDAGATDDQLQIAACVCHLIQAIVSCAPDGLDALMQLPFLLPSLNKLLNLGKSHADALFSDSAIASACAAACTAVCSLSINAEQQQALHDSDTAACVVQLLCAITTPYPAADADADADEGSVMPSLLLCPSAVPVLYCLHALISRFNATRTAALSTGILDNLIPQLGALWQVYVAAIDGVALLEEQPDVQELYLATQLCIDGLQSDDADTAALVAARCQEQWSDAWVLRVSKLLGVPERDDIESLRPPAPSVSRDVYETLCDAVDSLKTNHFDDAAVASTLFAMSPLLSDSSIGTLSKHAFMHIPRAMQLLLHSLNNIEQGIMLAACECTFSLLQGCDAAQALFLRCNGLEALAGCLHDYDIPIRLAALASVGLLASEQSHCRDQVRNSGLLQVTVDIVKHFPSDDVTVKVATAAIEALGHAVTLNVQNQTFLRNGGAVEALIRTMHWCACRFGGAVLDDADDVVAAMDATCLTLTNLVHHNPDNQERVASNGGLMFAVLLACTEVCSESPEGMCAIGTPVSIDPHVTDLHELLASTPLSSVRIGPTSRKRAHLLLSLLTFIVNAVDANKDNQELLNNPMAGRLISALLSPECPHSQAAALGCLLVSHLAWNHEAHQKRFSTEAFLGRIIDLLARSEGRADEDTKLAWAIVPTTHQAEDPTEREGLAYIANALDSPMPPQTSSADSQNVCLYALMAIINVSYGNKEAQDLIGELRGISVLLSKLSSDSPAVVTSATFALGNLVKEHRRNAELLERAGGVLSLLDGINDQDEDELSKRAFATLCNMQDVALSSLLSIVLSSAASLPAHVPEKLAPAVAEAVLATAMTAGAEASAEPDFEYLVKVLAVVNGMLYTSAECRHWLWQSEDWDCGVPLMLRLMFVPHEPVQVVAMYMLSNLTLERQPFVLAKAREVGVVAVLPAMVEQFLRENPMETVEPRALAYTTLLQVVHGEVQAARLLVASETLLQCLQVDVAVPELCSDAVELLVELVDSAGSSHVPAAISHLVDELVQSHISVGDALFARLYQCRVRLSGGADVGVPINRK